jgi:hypothetical protein
MRVYGKTIPEDGRNNFLQEKFLELTEKNINVSL